MAGDVTDGSPRESRSSAPKRPGDKPTVVIWDPAEESRSESPKKPLPTPVDVMSRPTPRPKAPPDEERTPPEPAFEPSGGAVSQHGRRLTEFLAPEQNQSEPGPRRTELSQEQVGLEHAARNQGADAQSSQARAEPYLSHRIPSVPQIGRSTSALKNPRTSLRPARYDHPMPASGMETRHQRHAFRYDREGM